MTTAGAATEVDAHRLQAGTQSQRAIDMSQLNDELGEMRRAVFGLDQIAVVVVTP